MWRRCYRPQITEGPQKPPEPLRPRSTCVSGSRVRAGIRGPGAGGLQGPHCGPAGSPQAPGGAPIPASDASAAAQAAGPSEATSSRCTRATALTPTPCVTTVLPVLFSWFCSCPHRGHLAGGQAISGAVLNTLPLCRGWFWILTTATIKPID